MLEIQKILAPTDFSERARAAAIHAAAISKRFEAELVFLHAVPPGPYDHASFDFGFNTEYRVSNPEGPSTCLARRAARC